MTRDNTAAVYKHPSPEFSAFIKQMNSELGSVGLCHGCFDVFHFGHTIHLAEASSLCDYLIVSVTEDGFVLKGPRRPIFPSERRALVLSALRSVDCVVINNEPTATGIIDLVRPSKFFKGADYIDSAHQGLLDEKMAVELNSGQVIFTEGDRHSSTNILAEIIKNGV